ncbi:hypothetical protein [Brevundimonas nasdae]|uniref:hypothetical protein n=1 Tax=Brevundimonas nasdae TaxID=172043 RepID=UPI003F68E02A
MTKERASIFGEDDDHEPAPPAPKAPRTIDREAIRRAAEAQGFTSREPEAPRRRIKRSNRTEQVSFRVSPETKARFNAYLDDHDVDHATFIDLALDALAERGDQ